MSLIVNSHCFCYHLGMDLIRKLLAQDPENRPSAQDALEHPWLPRVKGKGKLTGEPLCFSRPPVLYSVHVVSL